jgi:hypothetical protein
VNKNLLFCWPCLLFAAETENTVWSRLGFNDLKNIARCIERHQKSKEHIKSRVKFQLLGKQNIATVLDSAHKIEIESFNDKVRDNRNIMRRLIDITIYLCTQEQAFRGHDEREESSNRGNYKELVTLLGKYDDNLKNFQCSSSVFSGTSIQNDIINSIAFVLINAIHKEISESSFFSWQVDETTDITCHSQLSVIFRYVLNSQVVERFLGFYDVSSRRTSEDLFKLLTDNFAKFNLKEKLVAQTYDGAAVMAGELNGLQRKIKDVAPQATFTHCYAHVLNLVLSKSCNSIRDVRIFFSNLSGFSSFFSKSSKRTNVLDNICGNWIPTNAPTRWNFTSRGVFTIYKNRQKLIEVFDYIIDNDEFHNDQQSVREAIGLKSYLLDIKFCFLLETFQLLFEQTDVVFSILQNRTADINFAKSRLNNVVRKLQEFRDDDRIFQNLFKNLSGKLDLEGVISKKRKIDRDLPDTCQRYRQIFIEILETIIGQIKVRFAD